MNLPNVSLVRKRIEKVRREDVRVCLMCSYLFCGRVSELISRISPSDVAHTTARGPKGTDARLETFELGPINEEAVVFTISTAKRDGLERLIALPLNKKYEPWTQPVYDYFLDCGIKQCFPFTRQKMWYYSKQVFEGLTYPIARYTIIEGQGETKIHRVIGRHSRPFRTHALRHMRTAELIEYYGFDGFDLSVYGGWTLRSMVGVGSSMERYAHLRWRKYFPKLLKT